ncbi:uncharacterized protein LOC125423999 [Ziziphus jujuba]|uniref:Uncharacterized protein LOC125423999 n=1 Tax=Ziziphus jujuba TaxID=326968 RepID=A0ABM4AHE5_ZIZJJ|nr:uncharacterized protein LOC125423999 [Ziziphus jujuba]
MDLRLLPRALYGKDVRQFQGLHCEHYKLLEKAGYVASPTVYRAIYLPSNEFVVVKCLDPDRCDSNLESEVIGSRRMGWEILGVKDNEEYRRSLYGEITHKALPF